MSSLVPILLMNWVSFICFREKKIFAIVNLMRKYAINASPLTEGSKNIFWVIWVSKSINLFCGWICCDSTSKFNILLPWAIWGYSPLILEFLPQEKLNKWTFSVLKSYWYRLVLDIILISFFLCLASFQSVSAYRDKIAFIRTSLVPAAKVDPC